MGISGVLYKRMTKVPEVSIRFLIISSLFYYLCTLSMQGQVKEDVPEPPVLNLVSVDHTTGNVEISWSLSPSPDVSAYVVYLYTKSGSTPLDTIWDPAATSYLRTGSGSGYYSESFKVAAYNSVKKISPLSNHLSTIFVAAKIDTCNKRITVNWNRYSSTPREVLDYSLFYSVDGAVFTMAEQATPGDTNLVIADFIVDAQYCFYVKANLAGGSYSGSNKTCLITKMQKPPEWINADYARVDPLEEILLSFTPDPQSEIRTYSLERKTGFDGNFTQIYNFTNSDGRMLFADDDVDISKVNFYRLKAMNNCNNPITISNIASNIVLSIESDEENISLKWNKYREWNGINDSYRLFIKTGQELEERYLIPGQDTAIILKYSTLMYEVSLFDVCFMIRAVEASNPYSVNGESNSPVVCIPIIEKITVPTTFTPDNNSVNDLFRPVLSFTPLSYKLVITDLQRRTLFVTTDFLEAWDGTKSGQSQPEGVYLWFMNARTPSGKEINKTGSVTIIHNR